MPGPLACELCGSPNITKVDGDSVLGNNRVARDELSKPACAVFLKLLERQAQAHGLPLPRSLVATCHERVPNATWMGVHGENVYPLRALRA